MCTQKNGLFSRTEQNRLFIWHQHQKHNHKLSHKNLLTLILCIQGSPWVDPDAPHPLRKSQIAIGFLIRYETDHLEKQLDPSRSRMTLCGICWCPPPPRRNFPDHSMKVSDQHGHQLSRTRIFQSCSRPREYFLRVHSEDWSYWADILADPSLCWVHR